MHEAEKSDLAIVAVKPANNSGPPDAEWVEPRACPCEGGGPGPRGMRHSNARAGHRNGQACHSGWTAYGKLRGKGSRKSSSRFSTMLMARCCGRRSMPYGGTLPPERMV